MRILEGRITASNSRRLREIDLDHYPLNRSSNWLMSSYLFQKIIIGKEIALLQRHNIKLEKGDYVVAGGFTLFGYFMIMAIKNQSRDAFWSNNGVMQVLLGLFIISVPFWTTGNNPITYSQNIWLFMVLPFVLVGAGIFSYGILILRIGQKVKAVQTTPKSIPKSQEDLEEEKLDKIADYITWGIGLAITLGVLFFWLR